MLVVRLFQATLLNTLYLRSGPTSK